MESNDSRLSQIFTKIGDWLNEQVWFQQAKAKWDELDAQSRLGIKIGLSALTAILILTSVFGSLASVRSLRKEVAEKSDLVAMLQNANDEMRRLREASGGGAAAPAAPGGAEAPWNGYFESTAAGSGIDKEKITVEAGKGGTDGALAKESLYDLALKGVNIKQVIRYAFQLENGARPLKLRNLSIDTKPDMSGYLDATLSVSAFTPKEQ